MGDSLSHLDDLLVRIAYVRLNIFFIETER